MNAEADYLAALASGARWANGGTLLGAACFLAASILMIPEGRHPATDHD